MNSPNQVHIEHKAPHRVLHIDKSPHYGYNANGVLKSTPLKPAKNSTIKYCIKLLFGLMVILYPLLVFCALVIFKFPSRYVSIIIILFAIVYMVINRHNYSGRNTAVVFISPVILCIIGIICLVTASPLVLKLYPALADLAYLTIFGTSLFIPPPLVFYFVTLFDKSGKDRITQKQLDQYCRNATIVWCIFFILDGIIALFTAFWVSEFMWGVYNGGITYIIMGLLFVGQVVLFKIIVKRAMVEKKEKNSLGGSNVHS